MRTSPLIAVALAVLTACATEVKAPTASAVASLSVNTGSVAQLDGSASSDPAGRPLTYDWSFTAVPPGSHAALNDPHLARPSFTPDVSGTYTLSLVVANGVHQSNAVTVTVTAAVCGLARPVAQVQLLAPETAGPAGQVTVARIPVGATALASGAASTDPDNAAPCSAGQTLSYRWSLDAVPSGSAAVLNSTTAVDPSFTADVPGTFRLALVVTDSTGLASTAGTLTLTADPAFGAVLPVTGFSITTVNAGAAQAMNDPRGVAVDGAGAVYVAQGGNFNGAGASARVTKHQGGGVSILAEGAYLTNSLQDLALDTTQTKARLLATNGNRIVALDPITGFQSLFADFSLVGGGHSLRGLTVGVASVAGAPAVATSRIAVADRNNNQILLFDPAATPLPVSAATNTVNFGGALSDPVGRGHARLPPPLESPPTSRPTTATGPSTGAPPASPPRSSPAPAPSSWTEGPRPGAQPLRDAEAVRGRGERRGGGGHHHRGLPDGGHRPGHAGRAGLRHQRRASRPCWSPTTAPSRPSIGSTVRSARSSHPPRLGVRFGPSSPVTSLPGAVGSTAPGLGRSVKLPGAMASDDRSSPGARFTRWAIILVLPLVLAAAVMPWILRQVRAERHALPTALSRTLPDGTVELASAAEPPRVPEAPTVDQIEASRSAELEAGRIQRRNLEGATSYTPRSSTLGADGERTAPFHGFGLSIESSPPGALVRVDGAEVGETPLVASVACQPGKELMVVLERPGLRPARRQVRCRADALLELSFTLTR